MLVNVTGEAIPLQALTGPEGSRKLKFSYFKTIGKMKVIRVICM
jgi:hypothetical protein